MITSLIVAKAENNTIGKDNDMCWHLPREFKHFKQETLGCPIIMGRKNFESLPIKPLPKRTNIIVSRNENYKVLEGCKLTNSIEKALDIAREENPEKVFVIGGGQIYKQAIESDLLDEMVITTVHDSFEGDAFFPEFDESKWKVIKEEFYDKDEKNAYDYTIRWYERLN
jgi:dihydrofolate reductase